MSDWYEVRSLKRKCHLAEQNNDNGGKSPRNGQKRANTIIQETRKISFLIVRDLMVFVLLINTR